MSHTVGKTLAVLRLLTAADTALRVSDVSAALGVPASTAHKLLSYLERDGFVQRELGGHRYYAGAELLTLSAAMTPFVLFSRAATAAIRSSVSDTPAMGSVVVMRASRAYFIHTEHATERSPRPGSSIELMPSASGKALLASVTQSEFEAIVPAARAPTRAAMASRTRLLRELDEVRARGFATSFGEVAAGVYAVASSVRGRSGRVYGALALSAEHHRMGRDQLFAVGEKLRAAAERAGAELP